MLRGLDVPYADGHNVHGLVRTCDIFDIHSNRDGSIFCEDQEDTCHGGDLAACDIVFLMKKTGCFPKLYDFKILTAL